MARVKAALEAMGFRVTEEHESFVGFLRFEAPGGICVLILDGAGPDILESDLVINLDKNGVSLAEFWNSYERTPE